VGSSLEMPYISLFYPYFCPPRDPLPSNPLPGVPSTPLGWVSTGPRGGGLEKKLAPMRSLRGSPAARPQVCVFLPAGAGVRPRPRPLSCHRAPSPKIIDIASGTRGKHGMPGFQLESFQVRSLQRLLRKLGPLFFCDQGAFYSPSPPQRRNDCGGMTAARMDVGWSIEGPTLLNLAGIGAFSQL